MTRRHSTARPEPTRAAETGLHSTAVATELTCGGSSALFYKGARGWQDGGRAVEDAYQLVMVPVSLRALGKATRRCIGWGY